MAIDMTGHTTPARRTFHFTAKQEAAADRAADALDLVSKAIRIKILLALADGEKDVGTLATCCGISISAISQNMAKLKAGGMVHVTRDAQRMVYRLADHPVSDFARELARVGV